MLVFLVFEFIYMYRFGSSLSDWQSATTRAMCDRRLTTNCVAGRCDYFGGWRCLFLVEIAVVIIFVIVVVASHIVRWMRLVLIYIQFDSEVVLFDSIVIRMETYVLHFENDMYCNDWFLGMIGRQLICPTQEWIKYYLFIFIGHIEDRERDESMKLSQNKQRKNWWQIQI